MFRYIKEHCSVFDRGDHRVLLGLGLSYYLGEKWSTPNSVRAQRAEENQAVTQEDEELTEWVSS